jgi:hypothetical protein
VQPVKPVVNANATGDTSHAYQLLQQKQFAAAAKEAKDVAGNFPNDSEAWKIAGFAELNLKQYSEAAADSKTRRREHGRRSGPSLCVVGKV